MVLSIAVATLILPLINPNMKNLRLILLLPIVLASGLAGLFAAEPAENGFRFPGGDPEAGREAFIKLNCIQCHSVTNVDLGNLKAARRLELALASKLRFVKKTENIITAITNPKHVITQQYKDILSKTEQQGGIEPLMPDLTKDMSARQLMDIVAFLDEAYHKALPEYGAAK